MNKIIIGIIGLGVGERHLYSYKSHPNCVVKTVCDFDGEKLKKVNRNFPDIKLTKNFEDIFDDKNINLVSIASNDNFHFEQVILGIKKNKNLFVEKPICISYKELEKIIDEYSKNKNIKISSNLLLRQHPLFLEIKNKIKQNQLGDIYHVEGDYNYGRLQKLTNGWRGDIPFYSVMHGGGLHLIDLILWLKKTKVKSVVGTSNKIVSLNTNFRHDDFKTAFLKFEDDSTAKVNANFGCVLPHNHELKVFGKKGSFLYNFNKGYFFTSRSKSVKPKIYSQSYTNKMKMSFIHNFVDYLLNNSEPYITFQEIIDSISISLACEKSFKSCQWEKVNYFNLSKI